MATGPKLSESTIQSAVWQIELGRGRFVVYWVLLVLLGLSLGLVYTASEFRGLEKREAMDLAQVARQLARGEGFTTKVIRPLSIWQLQTHTPSKDPMVMNHPDLVNPPLYAWTLSGLFRLLPPQVFEPKATERFYGPERWVILPFNQICLLLSLALIYWWARQVFDQRVAATATLLLLFSDTLWQYGVSGLPTTFLLLLLLGAVYCLWALDRRWHAGSEEAPARAIDGAAVGWLVGSAVLLGLCFLTRYTMAWLLAPLLAYVVWIGRGRRGWLGAVLYLAVFLAVACPWLIRNSVVSGSLFGIARFGPVEFGTDTLWRSLDPLVAERLPAVLSLHPIGANILLGLRKGVFESLPLLGVGFLTPLFLVGLLYAFKRPEVTRLRAVLVGALAFAILGMAVCGTRIERSGSAVFGDDLLVLLYPLVAVFGAAFFYLLLDRIGFSMRLTRAAVVGVFALLNVAPLILTLLPPRRDYLPYPPYAPPVTSAVAGWFEPEEFGCSDLPWAMAWIGDRRTLMLPMSVEEFYTLNDFVLPHGCSFIMFTPYMLNRPMQGELFHGEYSGWSFLITGRLPARFPLRSALPLPPRRDQYLLADRERWGKAELEEPLPSERAKKAAAAAAAAAATNTAPAAVTNTPPAAPASGK